MSIVSMIDPSPDWIVGVSSLELCLRNCSWIESKILNLYPWDVGTDDGLTYLSPDQPSSMRQPIKKLRTNVPDDPRSPFYDPAGSPMKPFAKLTLSRQRLYEKSCDSSDIDDIEDNNMNCETTDWSEWSPCSATCGRGVKYKQRRYKNEESRYTCRKKLTERASCESERRYCPQPPVREIADPLCDLGPWSEWSSCSVTCGKGTKTRDRKYKNRFAAKSCASGKEITPILQQNLECWADKKCEDFEDEEEEEMLEDCPKRPWSDWSPCSATCGKGFKERYRISLEYQGKEAIFWPYFKNKESDEAFDEENPCNSLRVRETVECLEKPCLVDNTVVTEVACSLPKDVGACKSNVDRWYFDNIKGECDIFSYSGCEGNLNNFNTLEQCQKLCAKYQKELIANITIRKKDLGVTVSGVLSYNIQNDAINVSNEEVHNRLKEGNRGLNSRIDCQMSDWGKWSKCEVTSGPCGYGYKQKTRSIKMHAINGGEPCPSKLVKRKRCKISCKNHNHKRKYHEQIYS